ncbi:MAG: TIR domain-containing protein, partial [Clostridiales bacterium]|nr:TIR domain-containing protein [Clostridiales bacterium]
MEKEFLMIRTKPGTDPHNLPRVYFTCHPDDFESSFDRICEDIFKVCDCVIYYTDDMSAEFPKEYRDTDLCFMNLFVIPVTLQLLSKPNRAMDSDFSYAVEEHIPVLPVLMESGVEKEYENRFGGLQYLDPKNKDVTSLGYEEKLKRYFSSTIIDNQTAENVRKAFDAYIFLSYRKKDRKYANELMRLIHEDPICRDIAIWYDEFLIPGEDFSESIEKMLQKSNLFTLMVTPSIIDEGNYVQNVEYPAAKKAEKTIFPAEMISTDHDELAKQYPGMPEITDAHDKEACRKRISLAFSSYALRENDSDPKHNFLIGLAYLDGIDVEVNRERAVELIKSAAEADLPEAMSKLASMYQKGEGVKRDFKAAAQLKKKLADQYKNSFLQGGNENDALRAMNAYSDAGDIFMEIGMAAKAKDAYSCMLDMARKDVWGEKRKNVGMSYYKLGDAAMAEYDFGTARDCYEKARALFFKLADGSDSPNNILNLLKSYRGPSRTAEAEKDIESAEMWNKESLKLSHKLEKMEHRDAYAETINSLLSSDSDYETAAKEAKRLMDAANNIHIETAEHSSVLAERMSSHFRSGDTAKAKGDIAEAKIQYKKGYKIAFELSALDDTPETKRNLALAYEKLGDIANEENDILTASEYYKAGKKIRIMLSKKDGTPSSVHDLAVIQKKLGELLCKNKQDAHAAEYFDKAIPLYRWLVGKTEDPQVHSELASLYM